MTFYFVSIATYVGFFMIMALALNLQWGMTGMVNFGVAGFYAIGAYTSGLLSVKAGWPVEWAMLAAPVMGLIWGAAVALLSIRLREDFLAIVTLGFGEIVRLFVLNEDWLTEGPRGLRIDARPLGGMLDRDQYAYFYLALVAVTVLIIFLISERIRRSPYGRVLRAIREDDVVAGVLGKVVLRYRIQVFALGGAFMGLGGALYAHYVQNISPDVFMPMVAIFIWMSVIVGGAGNNKGLLIGAGVVMALLEGTRFLGDFMIWLDAEKLSALRIILIGVLLIVVLRLRPRGLMPEEKFRYNP
ncbi:branched-chain amino acid ABC transporter permease [Limibacillus halophilus]|uniref:Branched-chain amino acid transport system permease protein n=1 Tax=Limibacillus halophilus TaxID=1579333 RepID=A0A839SVC3_9PROT|nr:branched-chain amino acid ABC transporter permease [Limibacillus halophilus]MBB3066757.1 branched-chain amino acid transport system permease protein [Limibacillus halophilus]